MSVLALQDEGKAALRSPKRLKGLGVGGTRKRLRLVEHESKRLQQVGLHKITPQLMQTEYEAISMTCWGSVYWQHQHLAEVLAATDEQCVSRIWL